MSEDHENFSGTVLKALSILEFLAENQRPMPTLDIAKACSLSRPTAYRLLTTLLSRGFVRTEDNLTYSLGTKFLSFGQIVQDNLDLNRLARPYLHELCSISGEIANLSILDGSELLYIGREESIKSSQTPVFVHMRANLGTRLMPHCSAMGKAIMAYMPSNQLHQLLREIMPLKTYTAQTIVTMDKLYQELEEIYQRGYAIDDREVDEGTRCVAAPIFDNTGQVVAAMSVAGPAYRLTLDQLKQLSKEVVRVAHQLSKQLGYITGSS